MNIVLDTNVLVSGLLSSFSAPGEVIRLLASGHIRPCLDARILSEYAAVLKRPRFHFQQDLVTEFLGYLESRAIFAAGTPLRHPLPDRDDEPFLEVALAAGADALVTGNRRHFPSRACGSVRVATPAEFVAFHRRRLSTYRA